MGSITTPLCRAFWWRRKASVYRIAATWGENREAAQDYVHAREVDNINALE